MSDDTREVGLYVHVPFCDGKCPYCSFFSRPLGGHDPARLIAALEREMGLYCCVQTVRTAYMGGGSPTVLPAALLSRLAAGISSRWPEIREFTVECNPGRVNTEMLAMLRDNGVNRLSIGVQSFEEALVQTLGRRHTVSQAVNAVEIAHDCGFENVGVDLIFAIPGQTIQQWRSTLERAVALGVSHISAYSLTYEPGTPLHQAREVGHVKAVDEETDRAMYETAIDMLAEAGFAQYEISNFATDGYRCMHNQIYWRNLPYIGIGPSAASNWQGSRYTNVSDVDAYVKAVESGIPPQEFRDPISDEERICETAVLNLRMIDGIDLAAFHRSTGVDFRDVFGEELAGHRSRGLIEVDGGAVRLSRAALGVADSVLCDYSAL